MLFQDKSWICALEIMKDNFLTTKITAYNHSSYSTVHVDKSSFQTPMASVCKQNKCVSDKISSTPASCYQSSLAKLPGDAN